MADAFEDEMERVVTIDEYIEEVEAEELEADLVLGGDEGKECTYANGYMKRQAIFSCLTCVPQGNAGVCTACSLTCHDGHEMVELWTKRKFRCDCGNAKFIDFTCKLTSDKDSENIDNKYNHNFKGSYCTCGRPYPDPEAEEQVEMIQCCICEDWFHEDHLGLNSVNEIPRDEEGEPIYEDFICQKCAPSFTFLKHYPSSIMSRPVLENAPQATDANPNVTVNGSAPEANSSTDPKPDSNSKGKEPMNDEDAKCKLGKDINEIFSGSEIPGTMFLSKKWREALCRCETCSTYYAKSGVEYLIDKEDTIAEYEKMAKEKRMEKLQQQEGAEMNFLNKLDHVQKIEVLSAISDMKDELRNFLASKQDSADPSSPITSDDVRGIFDNLRKKKQRLL
ncbi:PHD finger protein-like protein [Rhynchospora pubera]|uniref:PHD finger protein-like protein n=1 Tax=Rhynchospora pubera TaxID=906938 RepID=A0AAV8DAV5_9POAL|nr:PHD finger protein-like protein [Rhynchospora pubera]KAJ4818442.1 PHD finger protein-like protein [Rhynchospora pubera]